MHYTGTLEDGTVFDSSLERDPLEFEIGGGKVIPGFDDAVMGLAEGETRKQLVPATRAYGKYTFIQRPCILVYTLQSTLVLCQPAVAIDELMDKHGVS